MRSLVVILALALYAPAVSAGGVTRPTHDEQVILSTTINGAVSAATWTGRTLAQPVVVTGMVAVQSIASGGGAGSTTFRVSDGTNHCDAVLPCTTSGTTGVRVLTVSGTCSFAAGVTLTLAVSASGCTTTQPTIRGLTAVGRPGGR